MFKEEGSALMGIIYLLVVIVWLSGYAALFAERNIKNLMEEERSLNLNSIAREKIVKNQKHFSFGKINCNKGLAKHGDVQIEKQLCKQDNHFGLFNSGLVIGKNSDNYPILDFNKIFLDAKSCDGIKDAAPFVLNPEASISALTCLNELDLFVKDYVVNGNLELGVVAVASAKVLSGLKIAATGYLNADVLTLVGPVVIIAGGDIHISSIIIPTEKLADILIYSATGSVTIDSVVGDGDFYIFSWLGVAGDINVTQNRLLPKQLASIPLYLKGKE